MKEFIGKNGIFFVLVIAALIIGGFLFYWYEWRPAQIRRECNKQAYDSTGLREFGDALWNPNSITHLGVKTGYSQVRNYINGYIARNTPGASSKYLGNLGRLNKLYSVQQNLAEKSWKLLNTSLMNRLIMKYPWIKKATWASAGAGAAGIYRKLRK